MAQLMNRRNLLLATAAVAVASVGMWAMRPEFEGAEMTPPEAHEAAVNGDVLLIDIRRPDEWKKTGIGEGAHPIDMRRKDFVDALLEVTGGDRSKPVALICAAGVRSDRTSLKLEKAGFTHIIDVPEGMTGSRAGPGWVERGLPVVAY
ncbi:molybdopterin biosynthesis protein MoeB [Roseovarius litorisediminis]|uniref:Molybdopterin biosynthesis protein MoeB n=1 Tax=Roseovarius litorisediminis TaxID=1312363 RepID=A0A1Y5SMK6_9RHOB|nr:rhodanese-like domain-containing protein [Roseovarius litorisediminis]SLN42503.1 molybdopterin biosynthesis protein MoeB [Roseovarius litorisediminis]